MLIAIAGLLIQAYLAQALPNDLAAARCIAIYASPDQRVSPPPQLAPGAPPVLSFRYFEGQLHHRYSNSDLMLDDAGH